MSGGTATTPVIEARFKPDRGREEVFIHGHVQVKSTGSINAGDLTLRTIKSAVLTPYAARVKAWGGPVSVYGSVEVAGSLTNRLHITTLVGTPKYQAQLGYGTQTRIGTIAGGSMKVGFMIAGA